MSSRRKQKVVLKRGSKDTNSLSGKASQKTHFLKPTMGMCEYNIDF